MIQIMEFIHRLPPLLHSIGCMTSTCLVSTCTLRGSFHGMFDFDLLVARERERNRAFTVVVSFVFFCEFSLFSFFLLYIKLYLKRLVVFFVVSYCCFRFVCCGFVSGFALTYSVIS